MQVQEAEGWFIYLLALRDCSAFKVGDWLDAYRYFDIALFVDDPAVGEFVRASRQR